MFRARKIVLGIAIAALAIGITTMSADEANAWGIRIVSPVRTPVYHPPTVHYNHVYQTVPHWTPSHGWHGHTQSVLVPHYVPGHINVIRRSHLNRTIYLTR